MAEPVVVRRVAPGEWRALRDLRLLSLAEAPDAFGSTYEREAGYDDAHWQADSASHAAGIDDVAVVAAAGDKLVAMARGYRDYRADAAAGATVWLIGVFVDQAWRGRGLARAACAGVIDWARELGAREVRLHVGEWNTAAQGTYESLGFVPTGELTALAHDPSIPELEMRLEL